MKIYWSSKSVPELTALPKSERLRLWRKYCWRSIRISDALVVLAIIVVVTAVIVLLLGISIGTKPFRSSIAGGLSGAIALFVFYQRVASRMRPSLRREIGGELTGTGHSDTKP